MTTWFRVLVLHVQVSQRLKGTNGMDGMNKSSIDSFSELMKLHNKHIN